MQVFDPSGRAVSEPIRVGQGPHAIGKLGVSPWANAARQDRKAIKAETPAEQVGKRTPKKKKKKQDPLERQDLYALFGTRIVIHDDRRITKAYFVDEDTSRVLENILRLSSQPVDAAAKSYRFKKLPPDSKRPPSILDTLLGDSELIVNIIDGFDQEKILPLGDAKFLLDFKASQLAKETALKSNLVLVTAKADGLEAFEQAMELFYRSVPQILIEAKVIEISRSDTLDIGVRPLDPTKPSLQMQNKGNFIKSIASAFPNAAGGATTSSQGSEGWLTLGGIHDNLELNAVLELLQTEAESDVVSQPRIAVRNGGMAVVDTRTRVPYPEAKISGQNVTTNIKFIDVGVTMQIRPDVTPGDIVRLQIYASVDAISSFVETEPIPTPQVASRVARTTVHVPSGKTTVIGGLITKTSFQNESKVPVLGDIPILGWLFRSSFTQTGSSEVVFMITPRIIYGFEGADLDGDYSGGGF